MQTLFNNLTNTVTGISSFPEWNYLRSGLTRNLKTTIDYYKTRKFAVKGNHLLAKLINSVTIPYSYPIERVYNLFEYRSLHIGMHFNMASSIHKGKIFDGIFYGEGTKEIIIATNDYISPFKIEQDWKNIQSVKVLTHPKSDLSLLLPNGKAYSDEKGLAVITVNIPALICQYYCFVKEQMNNLEEGLTASPITVFLHSYVIPNMLYSHLDHAVFNIAYIHAMGMPLGVPKYRHAFTLIDYSSKVERSIKTQVKEVINKRVDFNSALRTFPCVTTLNHKELLKLPEQAPTRQIEWVEFLARLKALEFLTTVCSNNGKDKNRNELNYLQRCLRRYDKDKVFSQISDSNLLSDMETRIKLLTIKTL